METNQPRPKNYLALAIISTILCCMITGIISIVYATQVNSKYDDGDYQGALSASKNAKLWGMIGVIAGVISIVIAFVFYGAVIIAAISNS